MLGWGMNCCIIKVIFLVTCTICQRLSVVILHMIGDLGLRSMICDGNPQLPDACGANNHSSPLVCLSYTWNRWCPAFLIQLKSSVGVLNSQMVVPSLPWLFAVVCKPHQWLLLVWDLELRIRLEPGTGSCLGQSFCVQRFPRGHPL